MSPTIAEGGLRLPGGGGIGLGPNPIIGKKG